MVKSKKLGSILSNYPPATAEGTVEKQEQRSYTNNMEIKEEGTKKSSNKIGRLVAEIPWYLKSDIKAYLAKHPGETERTLILKGLKAMGFRINETEMEDKRTRR
jgi:hypothetical protein